MLSNFSWVEEGALAGMGFPGNGAWTVLRDAGIGAVVSLTVRPPPGRPQDAGLEAIHLPIPDFGIPPDADLERVLAWMGEQIDAGRPVVVHCHAGVGRTGTVLAAFLVYRGRGAEDAIARVRERRPGSIETAQQAYLVQRFARDLERRRAEEA